MTTSLSAFGFSLNSYTNIFTGIIDGSSKTINDVKFIKETIEDATIGCVNDQYFKSCSLLANLCILNLYDQDKFPCEQLESKYASATVNTAN